jgi:hypothetical protein
MVTRGPGYFITELTMLFFEDRPEAEPTWQTNVRAKTPVKVRQGRA